MKKALVVVDYQNDFVDGALGFSGAELLEEAIVQKLSQAKKEHTDIYFTFDTHSAEYLSTAEGKKLPIPHCIKGTHGFALYGRVSDYLPDAKAAIEKETFGSLALGAQLAESDYDEIELCGLVSNICVISNAIIAKAACPNAKIVIDAAATDSLDKKLHGEALDIAESVHIDVIGR